MIDSHCHIDGDDFAADRGEVLARARAAGVSLMVVVGTGRDLAALTRAVDLAEAEPDVYAAVGVHPHDAGHFTEWDALPALAARPRVLAVGETGLDYHYEHSSREAQHEGFRRQVRLARELGKPVVCHVRDAHVDALDVLRSEGAAEVGAVIHCFTGNAEEALAYTRLGFYISFSGIITFKGASAEPIRQAATAVPVDRILLETDAPYLAPVPLRGKRNEPSFLPHTAAVVAGQRGLPAAELIALATENTKRFFRLTDP